MNFKIDLFLCIISPAAGARSAKRRVDLLYMECPVVGTQYKVLHGLIIDQRYKCFQPATIRRRRWLADVIKPASRVLSRYRGVRHTISRSACMAVAHCSRKSEAKPMDELTTAASRTSESCQLVSSLKLANCADRRRTTDFVGLTRRSPHRITLRVCGCGSLLAHKLRASLRSLSASAHRSVAGGGICILD